MVSDRGLIRRGQGAAEAPKAPLPCSPERVEQVRAMLRRDWHREPTEDDVATWCRWLASSGAWAPDEA